MERNYKRYSYGYRVAVVCRICDFRGDEQMKLSDYNKIINKMKTLGYPVEEMTAEDTWLMLRAFSQEGGYR